MMRVDFFLVFFFEIEKYLNGLLFGNKLYNVVFDGYVDLGGVFVDVCCDVFIVNLLFGNIFLIYVYISE